MMKTKKVVALVLAASMAVGGSYTAFAADNEGGTSGTGTVEGHVEKEVLNVVLPTTEAGKSAFSYTMDPERLIQGTDAAKYEEGTIFPEQDVDTGVYFLTAPKTYSNTSNTYQVINKSSCDVTLTVKVKGSQNTAKDISLAASNTPSTTTPELYLGLKVGSTDQVISTTEATVSKTIAGTPGNFNIVVASEDDGTKKYAYQEKTDASAWKAMNINMTGKVSQMDIGTDTTAPTVDVTWSWAKAAEGATADTDAVEYISGPQISVSATGLITNTGLTADRNYKSMAITNKNGTYDISAAPVEWNLDNHSSADGGSYTCQLGDYWMETLRGFSGGKVVVTLTDGSTISADINIPE